MVRTELSVVQGWYSPPIPHCTVWKGPDNGLEAICAYRDTEAPEIIVMEPS